jgi:hypothetical protein
VAQGILPAVEHQQARGMPRLERGLGDAFGWQDVIEISRFHFQVGKDFKGMI